VRSRRITFEALRASLDNYSSLGLAKLNDPDDVLLESARLLASHPIGYYDGVYLALAEFLGGWFVTADEKFYRKARGLFPSVVWLGDIDL